jgi:serine protease Do
MFKNFVISIWFFWLLTTAAYAQLPDFTEMVKNNGDAVVNISTTQNAPDTTQMDPNQQQMPQDVPPELEDFFSPILSRTRRAWLCATRN